MWILMVFLVRLSLWVIFLLFLFCVKLVMMLCLCGEKWLCLSIVGFVLGEVWMFWISLVVICCDIIEFFWVVWWMVLIRVLVLIFFSRQLLVLVCKVFIRFCVFFEMVNISIWILGIFLVIILIVFSFEMLVICRLSKMILGFNEWVCLIFFSLLFVLLMILKLLFCWSRDLILLWNNV